tara:strand:+ start:261 stop:437 length:177 start_codon:yes stop_codon:yes gene_type:complete
MKIENAQYMTDIDSKKNIAINATIDGTAWSVPLDSNNRHYAEILRQAKEEGLTIKDAD